MIDTYPTIIVPEKARAASGQETRGTKFKFRFDDDLGKKLLYKAGRADSGEDWSEKVSAALCGVLGIPHAEYDFAIWEGCTG